MHRSIRRPSIRTGSDDAGLLGLKARNPQADLKVRQSEERPPLVRSEAVAGLYHTASGFAGTASEQAVVNAVLAARTGRQADEFSSIATLIYGPVLRGTEVTS